MSGRGARYDPLPMTTAAAVLFAAIAAGVVAFQVALALGAPWGAWAMGGSFPGRFPPRLRVAAVVQAVLIALLGAIVLSGAGVVLGELPDGLRWLLWLPVAFSALSLVLNIITPSAGERRIWAPVAAGLLVTALVVAVGA